MPSPALVFVYGTLMRGHANQHVLVELDAQRIGEASTVQPRLLVDLGPYPALLMLDGASVIHGELYAIKEAALPALDAFEGAPDLYVRERIRVQRAHEAMEAWTYLLAGPPPPHAAVLATGRYVMLDKKP